MWLGGELKSGKNLEVRTSIDRGRGLAYLT